MSIFGSGFAANSVPAPLPLPMQLGATQLILGGKAPPLLHVSDSLINVLIAYDLAANASDKLIVQKTNAVHPECKCSAYQS